MNLLDITNEDIARLQENKIVFGLLPERDREILRGVDTGNVGRYCHSGFYRCKKGGLFDPCAVYRIIAGYTLPAPTEAEIIAYLQASEVPPAQWHPAAQEWARRHEGEDIWEFQTKCGITNFWIKTNYLSDSVGFDTEHVHRLRADYGKAKVLYGKMEDFPTPIPEPEVCVWEQHCDSRPWYKDPHGEHWFMPLGEIQRGRFCPVCGKRIEIKQ